MKKALLTALILIVIGVIWWNQPTQKNETAQSVTLGVIAGMTGEYAAAGEGYMKGFNLALEEWNNTHNLQFKAVVEDDGFNAIKGLSAYKKIKGADAVDAYAILSSFTIDATYDLLHQEGKPVALGFEQSKPAEADNIFQVLPAGRPVQKALGTELKKRGYTNIAVVMSNNSPVYQNFYAGFLDGYGAEGVTKHDLSSDISGIRATTLQILKDQPEVIVFFAIPKDAALMIKEMITISDSPLPFFAFDQSIQSGMPDYKTILADDMSRLDGSIVSMSKNDFTNSYIESFKEKYNEEPSFGSDMGYNSFKLLAETYNEDSQTWITNMRNVSVTGADGVLSFDEVGLRTPNVFFARLKDGDVITD